MLKRTELSRLAEALQGLPILGCMDGSPAARAGVRYGDVLLSVDGHPTPTWDDFVAARRRAVSSMTVQIFRDGNTLELSIAIDRSRPATPAEILAAGARALGVEPAEDSRDPV